MRTIIFCVLLSILCGSVHADTLNGSGGIKLRVEFSDGAYHELYTGSGGGNIGGFSCDVCKQSVLVVAKCSSGSYSNHTAISWWGEDNNGKHYAAQGVKYGPFISLLCSVDFTVTVSKDDIVHLAGCSEDNNCTCGKPCRHCCTCGKNTNPCGGTAADCACHGCTCGKCCSHTCTCGKAPPCGGKPGDCECHDNKCTCGACCSDKCECGKWSGPECHGTAKDCDCHDGDCWACCDCRCECTKRHLGPCTGTHESECEGDSCKCKTSNYTHCSCHAGGDHGDCCEHHKKDYKPPPDVELHDPGNPTRHDFTPPNPGKPSYGNPGQGIGLPNALPPDYEPLQFPEQKEIKKEPLTWFKRSEEEFGFPEFKHEEAFDKIKEELGKKLNFDWVDKLKSPQSGGGADLSWTIQVQMYGAKVGPYKVDLLKYLNEFSSWQITQILRFLLVFVIGVVTFLGMARLLLRAAEA